MRIKQIEILIIGILGLIVGFIVNPLFYNYSELKFSNEVNIIQLFSLSVTLGIAYLVSRVLNKQTHVDINEKKLLIEKIQDLSVKIDLIKDKIDSGEIDFSFAVSKMKNLRSSYEFILEIMNNELKLSDKKISLSITVISKGLKKTKDILTETPTREVVDKAKNSPVVVKDSIIKIHQNGITELNFEFERIKSHLFKLSILINKI